jgi:UDP-2-acetamido-3-amino-2,3-dideoxy-glucuronate N-acetyltransferase
VDRGELGKIQYIYSNRLNIGTIRTEENALWSFAPHDISVMLMLLKEVPQAVQSTGGIYLQHNIMDVTMTNFTFSNGVKAHIFVSWLHPFKEQKLVVVGDRKMAVFDDVSKDKLFLYPHRVDWIERVPVVAKAEAEVIPFTVEEPLRKECEHFLECIAERLTPRTDGVEGLRVLQVLQMSQESLNSGEIVYLNKKENNHSATYSVHESSYVDDNVTIGEGTQIWHYSHVLKNSQIGKNCKIGQNVVIGPDAQIGNNCKIQNNVSIYKGVTLEDDVFCGPSMVFTNIINPRSAVPRMQNECKTTLIKQGATLGANCTILCGITIGRYAFIGAGAVVTKNVADHALVFGNPAVFKGWMCACGIKLEFKKTNEALCKECGKQYSLKDNCVTETTKAKK